MVVSTHVIGLQEKPLLSNCSVLMPELLENQLPLQVYIYVSITIFMCILKYRIGNEWWKWQISKRNPLKILRLLEVVFAERVNASNGRWKCILRLNPTWAFKKSCDFALWYGITWLTSGPILMHSIWNVVMVIARAKFVIKVLLYNCLPERSTTTAFPNSWQSPPKATR